MAKTLFEAIGYALGHKAAQAKNAFDLVGGTEEDSLRAEIRLGRDLAAALLERVPLVEENEATRFAAEIGRWLAGNVKEKKLPFIVRVTAEREPNALALPGGPAFVSWPLLEMCQGQRDEIAFVLGHEMAHIVRQHTLNRIVKDAALSLLLRQASGRNAASAWLGQAGRQLLGCAFSRDDELELLGHPSAPHRASRQSACKEAGLIRHPILGAPAAPSIEPPREQFSVAPGSLSSTLFPRHL